MRLRPLLLLCITLCSLGILSPLQAEEKLPGVVRVMRVQGDAIVRDDTTQKEYNLSPGDVLSEKYSIITKSDATVTLIFSNGSSTVVEPNTVLSIAKFIQEPFTLKAEYLSEISTEPSTSNTTLKLDYGSIIVKVKPLRHEEGSTYYVESKNGVAGIRGTEFRFTVEPGGSTVSLTEGMIFYLPKASSKNGSTVTPLQANTQLFSSPSGTTTGPLDPNVAQNITNTNSGAFGNFGSTPTSGLTPGNNPPSVGSPPPAPPPPPANTPNTPPATGPGAGGTPPPAAPPVGPDPGTPPPSGGTPPDSGQIIQVITPPPASP